MSGEFDLILRQSSNVLEALAHEIRREIVLELAKVYPNALRVCEIKTKKCITRPSLSHHFKVLIKAQLIDYYPKGKKNYYYLKPNPTELENCLKLFNELNEYVGKENVPSN